MVRTFVCCDLELVDIPICTCNCACVFALAFALACPFALAFVVVDDEDKVVNKRLEVKSLPFRVYSLRRPGVPISVAELPGKATDPVIAANVSGELDLEASATLNDVVFWIGSHSASSGGMPAV